MYRKEILKYFHEAYTVMTRMEIDSIVIRVIAFYIYEAHRYMLLDLTETKYKGNLSAELEDLIELVGDRLSREDLEYMLKVNYALLPILYKKSIPNDVMTYFNVLLNNIIHYLHGKPAPFVEETDTILISALLRDNVIDTVCFCFPTEGV